MDLSKLLLKNKLLEIIKKINTPTDKKNFLESCLVSSGYMEPRRDNYSSGGYSSDDNYGQDDNYEPGYISDNDYNEIDFNSRTFIYDSDKLTKIQQRGIDKKEMELINAMDIVNNALNKLHKIYQNLDIDQISLNAKKMYKLIIRYYLGPNKFNLKQNKGSLKKGYLAICLLYSLNININRETLVSLFENTRLNDLPSAEKNIKMIIPEYSIKVNTQELNLCGVKQDLIESNEKEKIYHIFNIIDTMKERLVFSDPPSEINIAAAIYFVAKKYKLKLNNNNITYDIVSKKCGNHSIESIRKVVNKISENLNLFG